jgi:hypothetical protein
MNLRDILGNLYPSTITEVYSGLSAEIQRDPVTLRDSGSLRRVFEVTWDNTKQANANLLACFVARLGSGFSESNIPQLGDPFPEFPYATVVRVSPAPATDNDPKRFYIIVDYQIMENPIEQDPVIEWGGVSISEAIDKDKDGKAITNSSLETFDPPVVEDIYDLSLYYTRNVPAFDPVFYAEYYNSVNSDIFLGFQPNHVKCKNITSRRQRSAYDFYYVVTIELIFRLRTADPFDVGYRRRILDQGFRAKNDDGVFVQITDDNGAVLSEPTLLDGQGNILDEEANPVFLEFNTVDSLPFSALEIFI